MRRFPHRTPPGRAAATTGATTALCSPQPQGPRRHFANALHKPSSAPRRCFWEPPSARRPSTHELAPQLGPDALGLRLRGVDGVAQGPQVVVDRQALPHVEGAGAEMAERGLLHRRAEPRLQLGIPRGVHAVVLQPPGLPWGQRDTRYPSELWPSLGCAPLQPREGCRRRCPPQAALHHRATRDGCCHTRGSEGTALPRAPQVLVPSLLSFIQPAPRWFCPASFTSTQPVSARSQSHHGRSQPRTVSTVIRVRANRLYSSINTIS